MVPRTYDPVDRCIYCGAERYAADSNRYLAEEHIIPFGLNGGLVLPRSSCRRCERVTGRDDSLVLKGALLGCRTILGLRTRNPKDRPKALPLFDATTTPNRKVMVAIEDYPISILLLHLGPPPALTGDVASAGRPTGTWCHFFRRDTAVLRWKYGLKEFGTSSLDSWALSRVLAKIAHSYAVAELGLEGFSALLAEPIREQADHIYNFVGGAQEYLPPSNHLHEIGFEPTSSEHDYIVVRIRLFAFLGAPVYRVVVGTRCVQHPRDQDGTVKNVLKRSRCGSESFEAG